MLQKNLWGHFYLPYLHCISCSFSCCYFFSSCPFFWTVASGQIAILPFFLLMPVNNQWIWFATPAGQLFLCVLYTLSSTWLSMLRLPGTYCNSPTMCNLQPLWLLHCCGNVSYIFFFQPPFWKITLHYHYIYFIIIFFFSKVGAVSQDELNVYVQVLIV